MTGATGFLGAHLVKELLDAGERSLLCLVRGGSQERLWETLSGYFGAGWVEGCKDRVKAFGGDITQDRLGLPPDAYQGLNRCVKQEMCIRDRSYPPSLTWQVSRQIPSFSWSSTPSIILRSS